MKTALRKLTAIGTFSLLRNFFISLIFMAFLVFTLYVLITSPA